MSELPFVFNADHREPQPFERFAELAAVAETTGRFDDVKLDSLNFAIIADWPSAIHEGGGEAFLLIDDRATPEQRETARNELHRLTQPTSSQRIEQTLSELREWAGSAAGDAPESTRPVTIEELQRIRVTEGWHFRYGGPAAGGAAAGHVEGEVY